MDSAYPDLAFYHIPEVSLSPHSIVSITHAMLTPFFFVCVCACLCVCVCARVCVSHADLELHEKGQKKHDTQQAHHIDISEVIPF